MQGLWSGVGKADEAEETWPSGPPHELCGLVLRMTGYPGTSHSLKQSAHSADISVCLSYSLEFFFLGNGTKKE